MMTKLYLDIIQQSIVRVALRSDHTVIAPLAVDDNTAKACNGAGHTICNGASCGNWSHRSASIAEVRNKVPTGVGKTSVVVTEAEVPDALIGVSPMPPQQDASNKTTAATQFSESKAGTRDTRWRLQNTKKSTLMGRFRRCPSRLPAWLQLVYNCHEEYRFGIRGQLFGNGRSVG